jgi:NAD(P)H-dependent FMN reductase
MQILAISGSLRAASSNTALLRKAADFAPAGVEIVLYEGLGELPPFNPDVEGDTKSEAVAEWRQRLKAADGVVFSTPEYAHGVPGVLKNALDWVVGSGELVDKPVALFNASARGTYAQASLTETLTVMSARVVEGVTVQKETAVLRDGIERFVGAIGSENQRADARVG